MPPNKSFRVPAQSSAAQGDVIVINNTPDEIEVVYGSVQPFYPPPQASVPQPDPGNIGDADIADFLASIYTPKSDAVAATPAAPSSAATKPCTCPFNDLLRYGCSCGGS